MKVTFEKDFKKHVTLEEAPIVRRIIAAMKEDDTPINTWAEMAVNLVSGWGECCKKVYEAKASIAKNCRIYNTYDEDSRDFDIWLDITAQASNGFYIIGAYLSDIWQIGRDEENNKTIISNMYVRKFKEVK